MSDRDNGAEEAPAARDAPTDFLTANAAATPEKCAAVDDRPDGTLRQLSFAELEARSNQLAHALRAAGVEAHDRVVWCGPNSIDVLVVTHAARKLAITQVAVNYRFTHDEIAYVVSDCGAVAAWVDAEIADRFERIRDRVPALETVVVYDGEPRAGQIGAEAFLAGHPVDPPARPADAGTALTMQYTSGTTGRPKGSVRGAMGRPDQGKEWPNLLEIIGYGPGEVYITTGPLYHSGPGEFATISTMRGNQVVIQRRFDAEDWLRLVEKYGVSSVYSAPTPIRRVCNLPDAIKQKYDRSSVRIAMAAAAPWTFALKLDYLRDFPEDSLWEIYGSTELGVVSLLRPEDQRRKPGSCGQPVPGIEVKLFDESGKEVAEPGTPGELYVRSPLLFDAYHKDPKATAAAEREGFCTVGDIAYFDDEGFYYICDRKADMIISGGVNVYAVEVENALELHPGVVEAAVIGIPSEEWGEQVCALVVPGPTWGPDADDLEAFVRERLAGFKVPRRFEFRDDLPRSEAGKVLKRVLRAPYWENRARRLV